MEFKDKKVLVCGMARSGIQAANMLSKLGANVTLQDIKEENQFEKEQKISIRSDIKLYLGKNPDDIIKEFDLIVVSPGIPCDLPFFDRAFALDIPIWGEIELAYMVCRCPIIGITGTNGKTTTTALTYEIMRKHIKNAALVGNIGIPFCEKVLGLEKNDYAIAEISSFQLETIKEFKPHISAILNVTPDHLNRHKTMECYQLIKENIFVNQRANDYTILNYDDKICREMGAKTLARPIYFSLTQTLNEGVYLEGDNIRVTLFGFDQCVFDVNKLQIFGNHNIENVLAAVAMAFCAKIPMATIVQTLIEFKGVEHRIEYVTEINGVKFYNDSKATNTDAAIKSLEAIKTPIVLICGGYDKNADFTNWVGSFRGRVKHAVIIGEVSEKIIETCKAYNFTEFDRANTLKDAVELSLSKANVGDSVLLSPACASFDMFENYEQRGVLFKEFVLGMRDVSV